MINNSPGFKASDKPNEFTVDHVAAGNVEYTLLKAKTGTDQTIVFYPGMACNRFGHPIDKEPKNAVADLASVAARGYNIIFPEVHIPESRGDEAPIYGLTIDEQNQKVTRVLAHAGESLELSRITYVGQSLGCLAVAQLAKLGGVADRERAIFWGPPTLEGGAHREMLVSKFKHKPKTRVNTEGEGQLQFGNGRLMYVSRKYWQSLDDNSLRVHYEAKMDHYEAVSAVCASRDNFYPNNKEYLAEHAPAIQRFEIEGTNHTFRPDSMRTALNHLMDKLL